jgi:hypothetical protein
MKTRLKRLFKLCSIRIWSYNINTVPRIIKNYSYRIHDVFQAKKHDELTMKNHHQRPIGSAQLLEVQYNLKVLTP